MKYFQNIFSAASGGNKDSGKGFSNYLILKELLSAGDGMETSKRRDCDQPETSSRTPVAVQMEWRPQKEGIATPLIARGPSAQRAPDGMETSKRRDCDFLGP